MNVHVHVHVYIVFVFLQRSYSTCHVMTCLFIDCIVYFNEHVTV